MRKRILSPEELLRIRDLREAGASWLHIQRETSIPRRTARDGYKEMIKGTEWRRCADCIYEPVCPLLLLLNFSKLDFVNRESLGKICKCYRRYVYKREKHYRPKG